MPTKPAVLYSQTKALVIQSETVFITGPTTTKVKKPVKRREISGVKVKSTAEGRCLWSHFSKMDRIQMAARTGITWYW